MGGSRTQESINNNDPNVDSGIKNDRKRGIGPTQEQECSLHIMSLSYILAKIFGSAVCDLWAVQLHNLMQRMTSNLLKSPSSIPVCKNTSSSSKNDDSESWQDSEEPGGDEESLIDASTPANSLLSDNCSEKETVGKRLNKDTDKYFLEGFIDCLISLRTLTVAVTTCLHSGNDEDEESRMEMMKKLRIVSFEMDSLYKSVILHNVSIPDNDEGLGQRDEGNNHKTYEEDFARQKKEEKSLFSGQGLLKCGQYLSISIMDQFDSKKIQGDISSNINLSVLANEIFQDTDTVKLMCDKDEEECNLKSSILTVKLSALSRVLNYSALVSPQVNILSCFL
jgi:hypothetical protein